MAAPVAPTSVAYNIARDPALIKNRIFVGNLPNCTREELESICRPYGNVLGSVINKKMSFGFVQFDSEEIANSAVSALNKSTFKSNTLTVRNASIKKNKKPVGKLHMAGGAQMAMAVPSGLIMPAGDQGQPINDCEIIVVNRENTKYAEYCEDRLRKVGMRVDVLFPNEDVKLGQVLSNISSRGCLYAVLVTPEHAALNSITVNILYGVPAEHRNMPIDDAITLVITDFRLKKERDQVTSAQMMRYSQSRHPEAMQQLFERLAGNSALTALQYECVIKYLQEQRAIQLKAELGDQIATTKLKGPDPEIELHKKILNIMNNPAVTESSSQLMYPTFEAAKADARLMEMLNDKKVSLAMRRLLSSDLVDTLSKYF